MGLVLQLQIDTENRLVRFSVLDEPNGNPFNPEGVFPAKWEKVCKKYNLFKKIP